MIQDSFIESHIVRNNGAKGVLFKVFIIITALILIVILNVVPILLGLNIIFVTGMLSAALVWGVVVLIKRQYVEYEIEISNDLLTLPGYLPGARGKSLLSSPSVTASLLVLLQMKDTVRTAGMQNSH